MTPTIPAADVEQFTPPRADELASLDRLMDGEAQCEYTDCTAPAFSLALHIRSKSHTMRQCIAHDKEMRAWIALDPDGIVECTICKCGEFRRRDVTAVLI